MKKMLLKCFVFVLVFLAALVVIGNLMNRGNYNRTAEMAPATLPVITMQKGGVAYNELHGYVTAMDVAYQRETITELDADRGLQFTIDTHGEGILGIQLEVRSTDGGRLIENRSVDDISVSDGIISAKVQLKDLIVKGEEYALVLLLETKREEPIRYYTRIVWSDNTHAAEKLEFVQYFHDLLYSRERAQEEGLTKYLEPDSTGDNTTLHKVNIHSSFKQVTWGDLKVEEELAPKIRITELESLTGSLVLDYVVSTGRGRNKVYYMAEEFFRVRFLNGADRLYLLDYERTMTQIPDMDGEICANDKILLGIGDENMECIESQDGNICVFQAARRLFWYNVASNRMAVLFGFYDAENTDERALYPRHAMKVWDVDEGGNLCFAVYGYMNRGIHEGQVGIQVNYYDSALNMVEEAAFIPYDKSESVLSQEMSQLLYMNRDNHLYFTLDGKVYDVDIQNRAYKELFTVTQDGSLMVSDDHCVAVWQEGEDLYHGERLVILDLRTGGRSEIAAKAGESILPLGFMGEDVIYGYARRRDVTTDWTGRVLFPMYQVCICDSAGSVLKAVSQEGYYVTGCSVTDNQITLERISRSEEGEWTEAEPEHIMSNVEQAVKKNQVLAPAIDLYEKYVQIQVGSEIDVKGLQVLTPREAVFEGSRNLDLAGGEGFAEAAGQAGTPSLAGEDGLAEAAGQAGSRPRYYVYHGGGIDGIYYEPGRAVAAAYEISGSVVDEAGRHIWVRGNRVTRNQIMAIQADSVSEERGSLAVCLDTILNYEGSAWNTQRLLEGGKNVKEILADHLEGANILDLSGCGLDSVLYYVNRDIPVLALLENGEAVLVVGFNEFNVVIMDPLQGKLYQKGISDSTKWFEENGNCFLTYFKDEG